MLVNQLPPLQRKPFTFAASDLFPLLYIIRFYKRNLMMYRLVEIKACRCGSDGKSRIAHYDGQRVSGAIRPQYPTIEPASVASPYSLFPLCPVFTCISVLGLIGELFQGPG